VIKGGAFNWDADALRCGAYYWFNPSQRHNLLGFRLVWTAAPTEA
jgi:formylglycine-generating enzyme required for sulfatase activity